MRKLITLKVSCSVKIQIDFLKTFLFSFSLAVPLCAVGTPAGAETLRASIYAVGKTSEAPLFIQESERVREGKFTNWSSVIKDPAGTVIMTEKMTIEDGVVKYHYVEQQQINEAYELESNRNTVAFKTYSLKDGKKSEVTDTAERDKPSEFIMGPTAESYLRAHIPQLNDKKTLKVDFGIHEISRYIGFKFVNVKTESNIMLIKMKPSNFIIAALVDPIMISFDLTKDRIVKIIGRTPLCERKNGKWKPIDAEIIYH